jgi:thiol-disulfide isomerase/thioredoxin
MQLDSVKMSMIDLHPEMFLSKMMLCTKEKEPPVLDEHGDTMSIHQRREYYLAHFFDNMMLEDNALVRTPKAVFYDRVMDFYDKVLKYAPPQVIISYMDPMLERAKAAPDVFQYLLMTLMQKYLQSNVMVYDEVYVHLVKEYYATDANFWSSPSNIDKELVRANKWERLLVGRVAPELILYDTLHVPHSLHALPHKWKLLVFWSPNCGHCQHIIPEVYRVFMKYQSQYDIGAFTILSDPDDKTRAEWKKFMAEKGMNSPVWLSLDGGEANVDWHDVYDINTTPQIYLIDENNIIQAKKLGESSIEGIITAICGQGL